MLQNQLTTQLKIKQFQKSAEKLTIYSVEKSTEKSAEESADQ